MVSGFAKIVVTIRETYSHLQKLGAEVQNLQQCKCASVLEYILRCPRRSSKYRCMPKD